ncbi:tetratricopeptide repeat protein [Dehalobacter sp. DCM]|uniref:tetratricopeptide repeat protein n=1 Tax=Dehalobacter sp. DCM TaxID=2907827 RepID=UPI0030814C98|nr:tetratricopeptide repeat protein [Dehalobacter sp. DCM]
MEKSLNKWQRYLEEGIKYLGEGKTVEAEKNLHLSLLEAESLELPVIIAFTQRLLATVQVRNHKLVEAATGFKRALAYCKKLKNRKGIAEAEAGLASIYFLQGKDAKAIQLYKQAIAIFPEDSARLRLASLYSDLGQVYSKTKQWQDAEYAFIQAEDICREIEYTVGEAEINVYIGEIKYQQNYKTAAKGRFVKAAKIYAALGEEIYLANTMQYIVFICLDKNVIQEALHIQYRIIALYLKKGKRSEVSDSYYMLSNLLQTTGQWDEANGCMELSLQYYEGGELGLAIRYYSLAVLAISRQDYQEAKKHYFEALRHYQFSGDGAKIGEISEELTYLVRYEDQLFQENLYRSLGKRYYNENEIPKNELMEKLAAILLNRGKNIEALKCGWIALDYARAVQADTQEIEALVQTLSKIIRSKNKGNRQQY